jgi:leucyl-tRNA synthetase
MVPASANREALEEIAMGDSNVQEQIDGKTIRKVIAVPGKLVNIVAN